MVCVGGGQKGQGMAKDRNPYMPRLTNGIVQCIILSAITGIIISVVVKDLRLKDEDKDKDLKIGPRGSSRTRTFLEDNNTAVRQYSEIDMNLNLTGAQWQISHPFLTQSLQDDGA